jgi:hypothetical protein
MHLTKLKSFRPTFLVVEAYESNGCNYSVTPENKFNGKSGIDR